MSQLMTTREVAEYLRIKERKVYDLVRQKRIPCTRVTGKLLFPKDLIDQWVAQGTEFPDRASGGAPDGLGALEPAPAIVAGSHDPLLDWCIRESGCGLAMMPGGSLDGIRRLVAGEAMVAGMHVFDGDSGTYNQPAIEEASRGRLDGVLIEWAWRRQGLLLAEGNPLGIEQISDLKDKKARIIARQPAAGSRILFRYLLAQAGMEEEDLDILDRPAQNETDLGLAIVEGKADAGLAVETVARQYRLDFLGLHRERYDLLIRRRDYFEPPVQRLLQFTRAEAFRAKASDMAGYDVSGLGRVVYNAP